MANKSLDNRRENAGAFPASHLQCYADTIMSLIIATLCKDGCVAITDCRLKDLYDDGRVEYRDDYEKLVILNGLMIYNHGYNRINNQDWKLSASELSPDLSNPIYDSILRELQNNLSTFASYVFIRKKHATEISIDKSEGISLKYLNPIIKSGSGARYVDLKQLEQSNLRKIKSVKNPLIKTFKNAYLKQKWNSGEEFSERYRLYMMKF